MRMQYAVNLPPGEAPPTVEVSEKQFREVYERKGWTRADEQPAPEQQAVIVSAEPPD